jgi:hypothetical protein
MATPLNSESEALRRCNLPSTPHWRDWIRRTLPHSSAGGGNFYDAESVRILAEKVGAFASATAATDAPVTPPTRTSTPRPIRSDNTLTDRRGPGAP